ncbi:MAG: acyltransferase [Acidobacteria bacterium]|nr:acyltransferase [Acidobacteriota bacterium]
MRSLLRSLLNALGVLAALPFVLWAKFGLALLGTKRFYMDAIYAVALVPGTPGMLIRRGFYNLVLAECAWDLDMHFGSAITQPEARIARGVWIGAYSLLGKVRIGEDVLVASRVSVLSGARAHAFDDPSRPVNEQEGVLADVTIGSGSWLGEASVVMADIGAGCVVGAGSVVTKPVEDGAIVAGNPARILRKRGETGSPSSS